MHSTCKHTWLFPSLPPLTVTMSVAQYTSATNIEAGVNCCQRQIGGFATWDSIPTHDSRKWREQVVHGTAQRPSTSKNKATLSARTSRRRGARQPPTPKWKMRLRKTQRQTLQQTLTHWQRSRSKWKRPWHALMLMWRRTCGVQCCAGSNATWTATSVHPSNALDPALTRTSGPAEHRGTFRARTPKCRSRVSCGSTSCTIKH